MKKQNIVMIHAESFDGRLLGCLGQYEAMANATPNIDALAARGAIFPETYCTNPICCPSRANMWSGTYTHKCESWNNFKGLEQGMWAFPDNVTDSHDVAYFGKRDYTSGGHSVMARVADFLEPLNTNHLPVMDDDPAQRLEIKDNYDVRCHSYDWNMVDEIKTFLSTRDLNQERPFFVALSADLVHAAFVTNKYWLGKIPEELVDLPCVDESTHPALKYQQDSKAWRHGFDEETVRTVRRVYFAMCAEMDAIVGEIVRAVDEMGLGENTTIIFSSDHGELALEHQQYYKMSMFEGAVRVPLVMAGPGIFPGKRYDNIVSLIDMAPTLCDLAGMPKRECFDGESLLPLVRGETSESRNWAHAMYSGLTSNTNSYMLRRGDYKFIAHRGMPSQLFNVRKDPGELTDLVGREPEIAAAMEQQLNEIVDREATDNLIEEHLKHQYKQFRRQAKNGLYYDDSYGLENTPSSEYEMLMNNAFTGWGEEDEARADEWLCQ